MSYSNIPIRLQKSVTSALIMHQFCDTDEIVQVGKSITDDDLIKGGEGSKGGKVIGHTRNGKPIYEKGHARSYKNFNIADHMDARDVHREKGSKDIGDYHSSIADDLFKKQRERNDLKNKLRKIEESYHSASPTPGAMRNIKEMRNKIEALTKEINGENSDVKKSQEDDLNKAEFDAKERKKLSKEGESEKDGSYPIRNKSDLKNAIQAYGRSKDKAKTKAWIKKRAKELDCENCLPEGWSEHKKDSVEKAFGDLLNVNTDRVEKAFKNVLTI